MFRRRRGEARVLGRCQERAESETNTADRRSRALDAQATMTSFSRRRFLGLFAALGVGGSLRLHTRHSDVPGPPTSSLSDIDDIWKGAHAELHKQLRYQHGMKVAEMRRHMADQFFRVSVDV